jgi:hypothetical protein
LPTQAVPQNPINQLILRFILEPPKFQQRRKNISLKSDRNLSPTSSPQCLPTLTLSFSTRQGTRERRTTPRPLASQDIQRRRIALIFHV